MRGPRAFAALLSSAAVAACATIAAHASGAPPTRHEYLVARDLFRSGPEAPRWAEMTSALAREFNQECGDTLCEGDYSDIRPLSFVCSVKRVGGELERCAWVFVELEESIDQGTGAIRVDRKVAVCDIPVNGTAAALVDALLAPGVSSPLTQKVPGTNASIGDALPGCL
jgi:hypothetical protein